jgi:hypothetical protein
MIADWLLGCQARLTNRTRPGLALSSKPLRTSDPYTEERGRREDRKEREEEEKNA